MAKTITNILNYIDPARLKREKHKLTNAYLAIENALEFVPKKHVKIRKLLKEIADYYKKKIASMDLR